MNISIALIIFGFSSLVLLALMLRVLLRPDIHNTHGGYLVVYLLLTLIWLLVSGASALGFQSRLMDALAPYGFILSSLAFMLAGFPILWPSLIERKIAWLLFLPTLIWPVLVLLGDTQVFALLATRSFHKGLLWGGWGIIQLVCGFMIVRALRMPARASVHNQVLYCSAAWVLLAAADLAYLAGTPGMEDAAVWAHLGRLLAAVLAASAYKRQHLPVLRQAFRHVLLYLVFAFPLAFVLAAGFLLLPFAAVISPFYGPIVLAIVTGLLLLLLVIATWSRLPRLINRLIPLISYDPNRMLREYSLEISSTNNLEALASAALRRISEAIGIERSIMFNVEHEAAEGVYRMHGIGSKGCEIPDDGVLDASSPLVLAFKVPDNDRQDRRILNVTEFNTSPELKTASAAELEWFKRLDMEITVPILTKEDWIGLLTLGDKSSGMGYQEEDLALVGTLADQTSIALQNARLVESLMRLNNDFRRQYSALEAANRQLQQAVNQLQKLDQTKSDFISVSSHELRTPLTVARGYNEMLLEDPTIQANAYHAKLVNGIHSGMMRMHEIIDSMLDMASIDARSLQLHTVTVSLVALITNVKENLSAALAERKITLNSENLRDLPPIEADREMIYKVLHQLVINAIKYTPDGGSITVTGVMISPGEMNLPEGGVEIIVADTGIGIKPEFLDVIFTKFYKTGELALHSTGKTKFKGSGPGLGLAITKGIVEAHGGKIWAESTGMDEETCPGSQFHVILPLNPP